MSESPYSVIIADDHPIFRQGLVKIVENTNDFKLVGEAGDGLEALKLIEEKRPDIIVADISMPSMDGLAVIRALVDKKYQGKFIVLTMYQEEEYFNEAMNLGVHGYLLKECATADFLKCLYNVSKDSYYVSPSVSEYFIKRISNKETFISQKPLLTSLTPTERRVLKLIAENKTSKEIAEELCVSIRTIQNHRVNICSKLRLEGYNKLFQFAIENKASLS